MGTKRKGDFDFDVFYSDVDLGNATGAEGRGSRIIEPLLDELIERKLELKLEEMLAKPKEPPRPPEQESGSYRIGNDLKKRVDEAFGNYDMKKGDFVRELLIYALNELDAGSWNLAPTSGRTELDQ